MLLHVVPLPFLHHGQVDFIFVFVLFGRIHVSLLVSSMCCCYAVDVISLPLESCMDFLVVVVEALCIVIFLWCTVTRIRPQPPLSAQQSQPHTAAWGSGSLPSHAQHGIVYL